MIDAAYAKFFLDWSRKFEGHTTWMYRDVRGLVTTGVGNLIDPLALAFRLPWRRADGTAASIAEIEAEWRRVKAMPEGLLAERYRSPSGLHLSDEAVFELVADQLRKNEVVLERYWGEWPSFPEPAKLALRSMAWAVGAGSQKPGVTSEAEWPRLHTTISWQDWRGCADECEISTLPKGEGRNAANVELFVRAAELYEPAVARTH